MSKKAQISIFIIIGILLIFIIGFGLYIGNYLIEREMELEIQDSYTDKGNITPAITVPAPTPFQPTNFTVFFVPVNYLPNDTEFLNRARELTVTIAANTGIRQFKTVEQTYYPSNKQCPEATLITNFADRWYQRETGRSLPPIAYDGKVPIYQYRVIGIDINQQNLSVCGCAYISDAFSPGIYIGGDACSRQKSVVLHELGHSFGLCDEYDTCTWLETNLWIQRAYSSYCQNEKPSELTSDCGDRCCKTDRACCDGKYADDKESGYFNIMGSANIPPGRRLNNETDEVISTFLCEEYEICKERI